MGLASILLFVSHSEMGLLEVLGLYTQLHSFWAQNHVSFIGTAAVSDRSQWEDGHCLLFPGPPAPGHHRSPTPSSLEDPSVCHWSPSHCSDSLLSQNPVSRFPPPTWLYVQRVLLGDTATVKPLTYPTLGTPHPC